MALCLLLQSATRKILQTGEFRSRFTIPFPALLLPADSFDAGIIREFMLIYSEIQHCEHESGNIEDG